MKNNHKETLVAVAKTLAKAAMALAPHMSVDMHVDPNCVRISVNFDRRRIAPPEVGEADKDESSKPD